LKVTRQLQGANCYTQIKHFKGYCCVLSRNEDMRLNGIYFYLPVVL